MRSDLRKDKKMKVQSTVKKETVQIAVQCGIACLVLLICFFFLHIVKPEKSQL